MGEIQYLSSGEKRKSIIFNDLTAAKASKHLFTNHHKSRLVKNITQQLGFLKSTDKVYLSNKKRRGYIHLVIGYCTLQQYFLWSDGNGIND